MPRSYAGEGRVSQSRRNELRYSLIDCQLAAFIVFVANFHLLGGGYTLLNKLNRFWQQNYAAITFAAFFIGLGVYAFGSDFMPTLLEAQTFYAALIALCAAFISAFAVTYSARHKEDRHDQRVLADKVEMYRKAGAVLKLYTASQMNRARSNANAVMTAPIIISGPNNVSTTPLQYLPRDSEIYHLILDLPAEGAGFFLELEQRIEKFNKLISDEAEYITWAASALLLSARQNPHASSQAQEDQAIADLQESKEECRIKVIAYLSKMMFLDQYLLYVKESGYAPRPGSHEMERIIHAANSAAEARVAEPNTAVIRF